MTSDDTKYWEIGYPVDLTDLKKRVLRGEPLSRFVYTEESETRRLERYSFTDVENPKNHRIIEPPPRNVNRYTGVQLLIQ